MEKENGHFEVDFDTTTSGTKHINSCNEPIFCTQNSYGTLWLQIQTNMQGNKISHHKKMQM